MTWQDWVLMAGGWIFAVLLYPILSDEDATVPRRTSLPTAVILLVYAGTYLTLGLALAAAASFATAVMWFAVAYFRAPPAE